MSLRSSCIGDAPLLNRDLDMNVINNILQQRNVPDNRGGSGKFLILFSRTSLLRHKIPFFIEAWSNQGNNSLLVKWSFLLHKIWKCKEDLALYISGHDPSYSIRYVIVKRISVTISQICIVSTKIISLDQLRSMCNRS